MPKYAGQTRILAAVDCIIFGFDGENLKVLLMKRGMEPEKNKWSLIGNFLTESESLEQAAIRVLKKFTGIEGLYMHQLQTFSHPDRDPLERTLSTCLHYPDRYPSVRKTNNKRLSCGMVPGWQRVQNLFSIMIRC